jgi:hypothetical protein
MALEPVPPLETPVGPREPYFIAAIIDGVVHDIMNVDGRSAARFLAQPTYVQVEQTTCNIGWTYDGTSFTAPALAPGDYNVQ